MSCCMPYDCVDELVMDGPHRLHRIFMEQWSVQHDAVDSVPILMERHVAPRALARIAATSPENIGASIPFAQECEGDVLGFLSGISGTVRCAADW